MAWAIENRSPIACTYDGHHREVCPVILGDSERQPKVLIWQFGGGSSGGRLGWKCFALSGIENIKLIHGEWKAGARHCQKQECVKNADYDANPASPYYPQRSLGDLRGTAEPEPI